MTQSPLSDLQTRAQGLLSDLRTEDSGIPDTVLVTAAYRDTAFTPELFAALDIPLPDRLHRAVEKRRAEYLAGRAMTQAAMALLGHAPTPVSNAASRAPVWPAGLTGSISHARGRCACLLSRNTEQTCGIDTEAMASGRSLAAILSETLSAEERDTITKGAFSVATNATLAFSAKEALFKALYPRVDRHFGFDAAKLHSPPDARNLTLTLTTNLTEALRAGQSFTLRHSQTDTHVLTWLAAPAC